MFDSDIVSEDRFTEMSSDAQSLYFHLGMKADDEGFVSPKGIMRMISSPEDALKILIAKNYVIPFNSGVIVITDWKRNNYLQKERVKNTKYNDERRMLKECDSRYVLKDGLTSVKQMLIEDRIGEDRIGKDRIVATSTAADEKSSEVNSSKVIYLFKDINPSYELLFKRKNQHDAAKRLLAREGIDKLSGAIRFLLSQRTDRFCPMISSPSQLEEKWAALEKYALGLSNNSQPTWKIW